MSLDVAGLANVAVGPLVAQVWLRHCYIPAAGDPDPLWHNPAAPSRWKTAGGTVYVGDSADTVWAEMCRNSAPLIEAADPTGGIGLNPASFAFYAPQVLGVPVPARALYSVQVVLDAVADLADPDNQKVLQQECGIANAVTELVVDDYGPCPQLAEAGHMMGWQAVRAPSAAREGGIALAIFAGSWPNPADWVLEEAHARPKIGVAWLTRYKAGERPAWLT